MRRLLFVTLAFFATAAPAPADLTPGQVQAVEVLVGSLGDKQMASRAQAVERLIEIGPDVVPFVKKALAETADAEVKYRGELVLKGIMEKYGVNVDQGDKPVPDRVNFDASRVTLDVNASPAEVLATLAKQSGNSPVVLPPNWPADKVKLSVKDSPYWQALDDFCKVAGLAAGVDAKTGRVALSLAPQGMRETWACAGPLRVTLASVQSHRQFNDPAATLTYDLDWLYEDRLSVRGSDAWLMKVTAADGKALEVEEKKAGGQTRLVVGAGAAPRGQTSVRLINLPDKIAAPLRMTGIVRLDVGIGERSISLGNVLKDEEHAAGRDGLTLTVHKTDVQQGYVEVALSAIKDAMPATLPYGAPSGRYGFFLVDRNGKRYPGLTFPQNFKLKPHHLETLMKEGGTMNMSFAGKQAQGSYNVYFLNVPANEPVLTLVYVYPAAVVPKEYAFKLENVPLP